MEVTDFDYDLPKELIAQTPIEPRDASRLLVMDKKTGALEHRHFYNLPEYLRPGDVLVFNDTRVMPARLHGTKTTGAHVEVFLLTRKNNTDWEVLVKPGKKLQEGAEIIFSDELSCTILEKTDFGAVLPVFALTVFLRKSWTAWEKHRCRHISMKNSRIRNATRPCITGSLEAPRRRRRAFTLLRN